MFKTFEKVVFTAPGMREIFTHPYDLEVTVYQRFAGEPWSYMITRGPEGGQKLLIHFPRSFETVGETIREVLITLESIVKRHSDHEGGAPVLTFEVVASIVTDLRAKYCASTHEYKPSVAA